jgi:hypothetical protein
VGLKMGGFLLWDFWRNHRFIEHWAWNMGSRQVRDWLGKEKGAGLPAYGSHSGNGTEPGPRKDT